MYRLILFLLIALPLASTAGDKLEVLFLGNSYTGRNDLPNKIQRLAEANGDTLIRDQYTPGGKWLEHHMQDVTSLSKIKSRDWDYVVLQEQSQKPSFKRPQVEAETYPYAKQLDSMIRLNDPCTETCFYMTWGRENGDAMNCPSNPTLCTYWGMQRRLRESYVEMAELNEAVVAPVGMAWKAVRTIDTSYALYAADGSHPSVKGTYLAACVFYATLFKKSPLGNTYRSGLDSASASFLQLMAHRTVFDSLDTWRVDTGTLRPAFSHTSNNGQVLFVNETADLDSASWVFGNGQLSKLTDPAIQFDSSGRYSVELTVWRNCSSATFIDTISVCYELDILGIEQDSLGLRTSSFKPAISGPYHAWVWLVNGDTVSTDSILTHSFTSDSNTVCLIGRNTCSSDTLCFNKTYETAGVGIPEIPDYELSVYPNPFEDRIIITTHESAALSLFDPFGRLLLQGDRMRLEQVLGTLPKGVYLLQASVLGKRQRTAVVKLR